jgi:antitoxin component of MazEF toxin-antitoxin module
MLEFEAKVKRWGNSLAVVVPAEEAMRSSIRPNDTVHVIALRKNEAARRSFGLLPRLKSAQKIKDELRKELYD